MSEYFREQPDVTAPYGGSGNQQARGSDGSSEQFHSAGPASGASSPAAGAGVGNADGIGTNDDVSLPKLYEYDITLTGLTNGSNQGTVSDVNSEHIAEVKTQPKGQQTERGNMRFNSIISKLGEFTNVYEFDVTTSGVLTADGANVGTTHGNDPVYKVKYETKPWYRVDATTVAVGAEAVQRSVCDALGEARTGFRQVFYHATVDRYKQQFEALSAGNNIVSPDITSTREELTANALDTPANLKATNVDVAGVAGTAAASDSSTS